MQMGTMFAKTQRKQNTLPFIMEWNENIQALNVSEVVSLCKALLDKMPSPQQLGLTAKLSLPATPLSSHALTLVLGEGDDGFNCSDDARNLRRERLLGGWDTLPKDAADAAAFASTYAEKSLQYERVVNNAIPADDEDEALKGRTAEVAELLVGVEDTTDSLEAADKFLRAWLESNKIMLEDRECAKLMGITHSSLNAAGQAPGGFPVVC